MVCPPDYPGAERGRLAAQRNAALLSPQPVSHHAIQSGQQETGKHQCSARAKLPILDHASVTPSRRFPRGLDIGIQVHTANLAHAPRRASLTLPAAGATPHHCPKCLTMMRHDQNLYGYLLITPRFRGRTASCDALLRRPFYRFNRHPHYWRLSSAKYRRPNPILAKSGETNLVYFWPEPCSCIRLTRNSVLAVPHTPW
jgi:hypothetical protein